MSVAGETLVEIFVNRVQKSPEAVAMKAKKDGSWRSISFREFDETAREVAHGLLSLGLRKGDFVSLLSSNRPEWHIADVAVLLCGGATVPVYITNSPPQVAHVVGHSESTIAIVEDDVQLAKIMETLPDLPKLKTIVVIEPG
ncbi:MAG: AMP-binding protein, partial [Actinomycetota bacterium]|nr:AMP-binding protein [Actinomycetota bacterium]